MGLVSQLSKWFLNLKLFPSIGPLECKGKSKSFENGGSCQSLKLQGRQSGYYLLDTNNGTQQPLGTSRYFFTEGSRQYCECTY